MQKQRTTRSRSSRSPRSLPAKAVRRKTADGVKGGHTGTTKRRSDERPEESITFVYGRLGVEDKPQN